MDTQPTGIDTDKEYEAARRRTRSTNNYGWDILLTRLEEQVVAPALFEIIHKYLLKIDPYPAVMLAILM